MKKVFTGVVFLANKQEIQGQRCLKKYPVFIKKSIQ